MRRGARRWALVLGAGLVVVLLVGGRWLALETAERAWAASLPGGATYLATRDFGRLLAGLVLLVGVAWGGGNLLFVYRVIGSVQLPRRLGDLEIVEAVPQRVLFAGTVAAGLVFGFLLSLGSGDWWIDAALASRPPRFGVADPLLHRDLGYYLVTLPWTERLRAFALTAIVAATIVVALLYLGMGSLRFRRWLPFASAHARVHLGVLLALLALVLTWGAVLDPAQTVAGLHGSLPRGLLVLRLDAAPYVTALGSVTALASLLWVLRDKPALLVGSWGAFLGASLVAYVIVPGPVPNPGAPSAGFVSDPPLAAAQRRFEGLAFGAEPLVVGPPPGFVSPDAALAAVPVWDAPRAVTAAARRRDLLGPRATPAAAALTRPLPAPDGAHPTWLVALMPDLDALARTEPLPDWTTIHRGSWARVGPPIAATETDSGLAFAPAVDRDSAAWFGHGFGEFAVAAPDTWPAVRATSIRLDGAWRRTALAWALQSPELARHETDGLVLLWRRDVDARLARLARFASFEDPTPVLAGGRLWWVAYGYLSAPSFPLVRPFEVDGQAARYMRAAFLGVVNAASGDTRLYLAPGADSLARAWGTLLAPLIRSLDSLPRALGGALPYPRRAFRVATALVARWRADSTVWRSRPREPFELVAPVGVETAEASGLGLWAAQGFEAGSTFAALVAGEISAAGPRLYVWEPTPAVRLPPGLVGSPNTTAPGVLRLWSVRGTLFSEQALFREPASGGPTTRVDTLFLTWGERHAQGDGVTPPLAALRDLIAGTGARALAGGSPQGRWEKARSLLEQADAALAAGDLELFGRAYAQLRELLGLPRRALAPLPGPHYVRPP